MARPEPVDPVKLLVAVLFGSEAACDAALARLSERWGEIDFRGPDRPFDITDYYEPEMGRGLQRRLISFAELVPPEILVEAKLFCNEVEDELADQNGRQVNLDVGYLDRSKIVLASVKYAGQKIHLGGGIYADLIGRWQKGCYQPFDWTFPDFRDGRYDPELADIRRQYLQQLKARRQSR